MRAYVIPCAVLLAVSTAAAQVRVSGTVVEEGSATPISGALVKITGSDSIMTTGATGTFSFGSAVAGRMILTVAAPAYEFQSVSMELYRDTVLTIILKRRIANLDPMIVRPRQIRVRGTIVDSATGEPILFAQVALYPERRFVESSNLGKFSLDKVDAGDVAIVIEAMEHLPAVVRLRTTRDTTLLVRMAVDSVALRILGAQVVRLSDRAQGSQYTVRTYDRELIRRENRATVGEIVDRMLMAKPDPAARARMLAEDACVFFDDKKVPPGMLDGLYPEIIERIEVYHAGAMIRVYSKQYVMSLAAQPMLRAVTYIPTGLRVVCE